jgi:hypothetical protein
MSKTYERTFVALFRTESPVGGLIVIFSTNPPWATEVAEMKHNE